MKYMEVNVLSLIPTLYLLQFFFLMLTISLFSSMNDTLLILKRFRSMPLHASSSWHLSITYMPSTPCSPSLSHAYHLMLNDHTPCLFLTIYTLFTICTPCPFLIIYIHIPYVFHTSTTLSSSISTYMSSVWNTVYTARYKHVTLAKLCLVLSTPLLCFILKP